MDLTQPLQTLMQVDHSRIETLLRLSLRGADPEPYRALQECLRRHIAIEEKILFPLIRVDFAATALLDDLQRDHANVSDLLSQAPRAASLDALEALLSQHAVKEHDIDGVYAHYDRLAADQREDLMQRIWTFERGRDQASDGARPDTDIPIFVPA